MYKKPLIFCSVFYIIYYIFVLKYKNGEENQDFVQDSQTFPWDYKVNTTQVLHDEIAGNLFFTLHVYVYNLNTS